jgi:hypothetical protein
MATPKLFKPTDAIEQKVYDAFYPLMAILEGDKDSFYAGAYEAYPLGDVLYDTGHPLTGIVSRETFRASYPAIHELFTRSGPFEFYLTVFRAIWGNDVQVEFIVPSPGVLQINIEALAIQQDFFMARRIVDNAYVYDEVIDDDGDNIVFQTPSGIKTQDEVNKFMRELHPDGLYVETTLELT